MKKLLLLLIVILSGSFLHAQSKETDSEKIVQQAITNAFEALSNRDSAALRSACTHDVLFIEYGLKWSIDTLIRKGITQNRASDFRRINRIEFISTTIKNDVAWVAYRNKAEIISNAKSYSLLWLETAVLIKEDKNWKITLLHSTLLEKE